jgi:hypothetical protein
MNIILDKSLITDSKQPKVFELGQITTTLQDLLDNSTIVINGEQTIILSITDENDNILKYLLPLDYKGESFYGLGKNITEEDLIEITDSGDIQSVSGNLVDNSDPRNPVIDLPYKYIVGIFNEENIDKFKVLENTLDFMPTFVKPSTGRWEVHSPDNNFIINKTTFELQQTLGTINIQTGLTSGYGLPEKIIFTKRNPVTNLPDDFENISGAKLEIRIYG